MTLSGVRLGAMRPNQFESTKLDNPASTTDGTSGRAGERVAEVTAIAWILPLLMWLITVGGAAMTSSTVLEMTPVVASPAPLKGICAISKPATRLNNSPARCDDEPAPPYNLRVKSPSGKTIVERVLRELPTGQPQSAPPVSFTVSTPGEYTVEIKQLYGKQKGDAILRVVD